MMAHDSSGTDGRLRAGLGVLKYRPAEWFLLSGNRLVVSAVLLAVVGALVWGTVLTGLAPLAEPTPILFVLFALVGGNFTLITIVVSISQFVLARHLESPGEIREQLREIVGYREEVSEVAREGVLPVTPRGFDLFLFRNIGRDAERLRTAEWEPADPALREEIDRLAADLSAHAEHVIDLLEAGGGGTRQALFATLNASYSRVFYDIYRLRAEHGDDLPEEVTRLERYVEQVDVARRYFKTISIQSQLSSLTRLLLYIGPPIQIASVLLMLLFTAPGSSPLPRPVLAVGIPLVVTLGFAPFALLTAYLLRLATIVERTAVMYPFAAEYDGQAPD
jgi:hypothetical protein